MRRLLLIAIAVVLSGYTFRAATPPTLGPGGAAAIDRVLQEAADAHTIPGVVAAVINQDGILYLKAFGRRDVSRDIPMTVDTTFRIASMTKPITSAGIMMLYEAGKLQLDDEVATYLPAYRGRPVIASFDATDASYTTRPPARATTIRQLLTHTAGLSYEFNSATILALQRKTGTALKEMPLSFDPGTRWHYSPATAILGDIIEKISGQTIGDWHQARVFSPLRMTDTTYTPTAAQVARLTAIHQQGASGLTVNPAPATFVPDVRADGGLVSTATDYAAFVQMLLNDGTWRGTQLLKPETVRMMRTNQIGALRVETMPAAVPQKSAVFPFGAGKDTFGFGFQITTTEGRAQHERSAGSYTWAGINNTHFWVDPARGVGVVFMTQVLPFYNATTMNVLARFEHALYEHLQ